MRKVTTSDLRKLHVPSPNSHKGQNGRLLLIGGSKLFHAASLWALEVASRIVDLVHYASVPDNNDIVRKAKEEFRNGIVIPREDIEEYIEEDDAILIGPGMLRSKASQVQSPRPKADPPLAENPKSQIPNSISEILKIKDEGVQTAVLTNYLLKRHPSKQWIIDAGALQMVDVSLIPKSAILTPHHKEFFGLIAKNSGIPQQVRSSSSNTADRHLAKSVRDDKSALKSLADLSNEKLEEQVRVFAKKYSCIVLLKGKVDIVSNGKEVRVIEGGNEGMTKGGTGDVLAGLISALACKNDPFLSCIAGSYINNVAGDEIYKTVGPYFNASDLADQIPRTMKKLLID